MERLVKADAKSPVSTVEFAASTGEARTVRLGEGTVRYVTFGPGWRWSQHVGPSVGTASCQTAHMSYVVSGRHRVRMEDGTELDLGPGDVVQIPPGHDAWTLGDEPCVIVDFGGMHT